MSLVSSESRLNDSETVTFVKLQSRHFSSVSLTYAATDLQRFDLMALKCRNLMLHQVMLTELTELTVLVA